MKINSITTGYNRINFGQRNKKSNNKSVNTNNKKDVINYVESAIIGIAGATYIYGAFTDNNAINTKRDDFYERLNKIAQSDTIKKDTFTITDYNKDKSPDMILYKKDGSKVVVDIKNQKIMNAKNNNK